VQNRKKALGGSENIFKEKGGMGGNKSLPAL